MNFILKLTRSVVNSTFGQIKGLANQVTNEITQPVQGFISLVSGGIWKGDGATRFTEEMTKVVVPQLVNIFNIFDLFGGAINKSVEIMNRADRDATSKANGLVDVFNKIF